MNATKYACCVALALATQNAVASESPEVISMLKVTVADNEIALPKTRLPDGQICQSYISKSSLKFAKDSTGQSQVDVTIAQICGEPFVATHHGYLGGQQEIYPKQLKAIRWVSTADGLGIHALETSN